MSIEQVVDIIKDVGFPIFVSTYLLIRLEKKLDKLIEAVNGVKPRISGTAKD